MNSTVKTLDDRLPLRRSTIERFHLQFRRIYLQRFQSRIDENQSPRNFICDFACFSNFLFDGFFFIFIIYVYRSSKIFSSRLFKVSSFSLMMIYCCESLFCNDGSKLVIKSSTSARSFLCSMTSADFPLRIFLCFLSTSAIIVPKSGSRDHAMNLFRVPTYNNWLK